MNLNPAHQFRVFAELAQDVQTELSSRFIKWASSRPEKRRGAPALRQGQWLPVQTTRDAAGHEKPLGEGGQGVVHLWCCVDANNRIIDRVIVKNIFPGTEAWSMPRMWRKGLIGHKPREAYICNRIYDELELEEPGDGKYVTRCLGYGDLVDPYTYSGFERDMTFDSSPVLARGQLRPMAGQPITHQIPSYKLYFEYCPHGDLHDQIHAQAVEKEVPAPRVKGPGGHMRVQKVRAPDGRMVPRTIKSGNVPFHEGFVWRMFEAMAKCAVAMERANVLHGDLCPTNVFLGGHDPNRFAIWPTPKLSDFGSSRMIDVLVQNRFAPLEPMQLTFVPPELAQTDPETYEVDGMRVSRKTNIWQIGMLIACMMRLNFYPPECEWRYGRSEVDSDDELHFNDPDRRELRRYGFQHDNCDYSDDLLDLVRQCMRFDSNLRPSPRHLLRTIQLRIPGNCGGMDTYTGNARGKIPWNKKERLRGVRKDEHWPVDGDAETVLVF